MIKAERFAEFQKVEDTLKEKSNSISSTKELMDQLYRGLDLLPAKTRKVFLMSRIEHQTIKKIAMALQLSEKAVEYHITKSLKTLRVVLRDYLTIGILTLGINIATLIS